jgi:O-methyltransferase involved in polyketide biosynthesis
VSKGKGDEIARRIVEALDADFEEGAEAERNRIIELVEGVRKDEEYLNQYMVRNRVIDEVLKAIREGNDE